MPPPVPRRITVLGGGLSGLSAAYHLSRLGAGAGAGQRITLIESSDRVGGWIDSRSHPVGFKTPTGVKEGVVTLESGPRSIRPRGSKGASGMLRMLRDLDMLDSIIPVPHTDPAAKNRYLLDTSTSRLTALPSSPLSLLRPQPPLLKGLVRSALSEPFRPRRVSGQGENDESVDSFFRRRFGEKVATNLASAMVHGIYAASSTRLSVRSAFPILWDAEQGGSVVKGMLLGVRSKSELAEEEREWEALGQLGKQRKDWSLYGLKGGLGSLTDALTKSIKEAGVEIRAGQKVERIDPSPSHPSQDGNTGGVRIRTSTGETIETDHIVSALPPPVLSSLLPQSGELALPYLDANPYTSVGVVNLVYPLPPSSVHPAGFGYLIPRPRPSPHGSTKGTPPPAPAAANPSGVLGVIFDSTAIPSSPAEVDGQITKLTIMLGGPYWSTYQPLLSPPTDTDDLIRRAVEHLHTVFPHLSNVQPLLQVGRIHANCIPTYLPNHGDRLRELHHAVAQGPWGGKLSLVGNGYGGVGVNDCVYSAESVGRALAGGEVVTGLERWAGWE